MAYGEQAPGAHEKKRLRKLEVAALVGAFALGTAAVIATGSIIENPGIATFAGILVLVGGIALYDRFRRQNSSEGR